jgi:predicted trehalose synthase
MSNEDNALQENANKTKDLGQILASITNILARCEDSFRVRHNKPPRIMERLDRALLTDQKRLAVSQLDEIREFLVSFQEVMDAQQDRERDRAREDQRS